MATYMVVAAVWLLFLAPFIFSLTSNQKCLKAEFDYGREFVWIQPLHNVYDDMPITSAAELAQGSYFTNGATWATGSTLTGFEDTDTETIIFTNNAQDSQLELILAHDAPCSPSGTEYCRGGSNHAHTTGCGSSCDSDGAQIRLDIQVAGCCGGDCNCPMPGPITINYAASNKNRNENDTITDYSQTCNMYVDTPDDSYLWNTAQTRGTFTVGNMGSTYGLTNRGMVLGSFPTTSDWCMDMEYVQLWGYPTATIDAYTTPGIKYFSFVTELQRKSDVPVTAQLWDYATFDRATVGSRVKICNMNCSMLCSDYTDCGSCLSHSACGWCGTSGTCVLASTDTPNAAADPATCPSGFLNSACTDCDCQTKSDCSSCLATPGCGYCYESHLCLPGTSKAPSSCAGSCDYWFADSPSQCAGPEWPGATAKPTEDSIFDYRFENNAKAGWIAYDPIDGENAPSQWLLSNHQVVQLGSIYTGAAPNLEGTWLYLNDMLAGYGSAAQIGVQWQSVRKNQSLSLTELVASGNPLGIAFRYLDSNNFYIMEYANADPLVCDTEIGRPSYRTQRLKKKTKGVYSVLWENDIGYDVNYPYVLSIQVYEAFNFNNDIDATQIILSTILSDGTTVVPPDSNSFTSHIVITDTDVDRPLWGTVALATANNSQTVFDNVIVKRLSAPLQIGENGLYTGVKETAYTFNFNTSDFSIGANDYYWISVSLYVLPSSASSSFLQNFPNFTLTFNSSDSQLIMNGTSTPGATQLTTFLAGRPASDDYRVFINNSYLPSLSSVFSIILDVTTMQYFEATPGQATLVSLDDNGMWGGYTNISFSLSSLSFVLTFDPHPTSYVTVILSPFYPTALSSSAFTISFPPTWSTTNLYEINYPSPVPSTNYYLFFYQQSTNTTSYIPPIDLWISVSYPFPMLTAVTPAVGPTTDLILTLTGMDFTTNLQGGGSVTVGGRQCPYTPSNWQPTQILCNFPSGTGANHLIIVDTGNAADPLPSVYFSYAAPAVQTVTTTQARTKGGDSLTLIGSNFGVDRSVTSVTVGGGNCNITSIIETRIVCSLPPGRGTQVPVAVTVDSQTGQTVTMDYDGPSISSINPLHGPSGTVLTLYGNNFGNATLASTVTDPTCINPNNCKTITFVTIDKLPCTPVVESNPTYDRNVEVHCTVPTLVGQNHLLQIAVSNQFGNPQVFSYDPPQIGSVNPNHGPTSGTIVTVYGANFGGPSTCSLVNATVTDYLGRIVYGSNLACINDSQITFQIGSGIGVNHTIQLRIAGQVSNGVLFAYDAPTITSILPASATTQGGLLTLSGSNFGATADEPNLAILVNGLACVLNSQSFHNQSMIICQYPAGEGRNKAVKITLGGLSVTASQVFNYSAPTISAISPTIAPISPSSWLTITGSDFGTPRSANASIGGTDCLINTALSNHTRIVCLTPAGQGTALSVKVTTGSQTATATQTFSYTGPSIYSFTPSHGPTDGTGYIEITGDGFGTSGTVKVGNISCTALVHTNDFLRYTVGAGEGFNLPVTVTISGQVATASSWSYDGPTVTSLSAASSSTAGNVPITIRGANLGTGSAQYYLQFGGSTVSSFLSQSSSQVAFNIPPGSGKVTSIIYTIKTANGNQTTTYTNQSLFAYDAPILTTLTGCGSGCTGVETAVITGSNFGPAGGAATVTITSQNGSIYQCTSPTVVSHTSLNCHVPVITEGGRNLTVTVTINGQTTSKNMIDYQGPQITSGTLQFPCPGSNSNSITLTTMNGGDSICFSGTGFGATQALVAVSIGPYTISGVTGWFPCDITNFQSTSITCTTNEGGGSNLRLRVVVNGAITEGSDVINYPTPTIVGATIRANVTSTQGATSFPSTNTQGQAVVFDVTHLPRSYQYWPLVTVTASNDNGATNYLCQNVQIFSLQGSGASTPAVFGSTFVYSGATANLRALRCVTSPAVGTGYKFVVTVNGKSSARGSDTFNYPTTNVPTVTSLSADANKCTASGNSLVNCEAGTTITITGTNFCDSSCSFNVLLGGVMVSEQSYVYVSGTEYHFDLPDSSGSGLFVQVLRDTYLSQANSLATVSYEGATVSSIQAPSCTLSGFDAICPTGDSVAAYTLTIHGSNFGTSGASVFVGGMYCTNLIHVSDSQLTCNVPLGRDSQYPIAVLKLGASLITSSFSIYFQNCPSGTYRSADPSSSLDCIRCPTGTYSYVGGTIPPTPSATACELCDTGYTNVSDSSDCQPCAPGSYSVASSVQGEGPSCVSCPPGRSSGGTTDYCDPCLPGKSTKNLGGATLCTDCNAGYYSSALGSANCTRCLSGTISSGGTAYCTACEAGKYESNGTCINCVNGQYSSIAGATTCSTCPAGAYSKGNIGAQTGNLQCLQCSAGLFSNSSGASDCYSCAAGYYSVQTLNGKDFIGATSCTACSSGQYSVIITTPPVECQFCDKGKYSNTTGSSACTSCGAGYYNADLGQSTCLSSRPGTFVSGSGAVSYTNCYAGSFNNMTASSNCDPCDPGFYQPLTGATSCEPCLAGKFTLNSGQFSCSLCSPGYYAVAQGMSTCQLCAEGKYSSFGASNCSSSPQSYYNNNPGQNVPLLCDPGTVSNSSGAVACTTCQPGTFAGILRTSCDLCPLGYYTAQNATVNCLQCASGRYSNLTGTSQCALCPAGRFQSNTGSSTCLDCPPGKSTTAGLAACFNCPAGSYTSKPATSACISCNSGSIQPLAGQSTCNLCAPGTYVTETGQTSCRQCEAGSYAPFPGGSSQCQSCPSGSFSDSQDLTKCTPCAQGTYMPVGGQSSCQSCSPGKFADTPGYSNCQDCPAGKRAPSEGMTLCLPCDIGKYTSNNGSSYCQACLAGTFMNGTGASKCTECYPGFYQDAVQSTVCKACALGYSALGSGLYNCAPCSAGTFANVTGLPECYDCPAGTYQNNQNATICENCDAGKRSSRSEGSVSCVSCAEGFHAADVGSGDCTECPAGKISSEKGAINCTDCDLGKYVTSRGQSVCTVCEAGRYGPNASLAECLNCPVNQVSTKQLTACVCKAGYFNPINVSGVVYQQTCSSCLLGAVCNGAGNNLNTIVTAPGYWRPSTDSLAFYQCLVPTDCQGGLQSTCGAYREGPICALCAPGSRKVASGDCSPCDTKPAVNAVGTTFIIIAIAFAIWVTFFFVIRSDRRLEPAALAEDRSKWHSDYNAVPTPIEGEGEGDGPVSPSGVASPSRKQAPSSQAALASQSQLAADFPEEKKADEARNDDPASAGDITPPPAEVTENPDPLAIPGPPDAPPAEPGEAHRLVDPTTGTNAKVSRPNLLYKIKIILSFFQIAVGVVDVIPIQWPSAFHSFLSIFNIFNIDFLQWSSVDCIATVDYYLTFVITIITPPCLLIVIVGVYLLPVYLQQHQKSYEDRFLELRARHRNAWKLFLFSLFLMYPKVSATVLQMYVCREVEGTWYMVADFTLECYDTRWYRYLPVNIISILVYPVGIPLMFFTLLLMNRKSFFDARTRIRLGLLYDAYAKDTWWFELVDMSHKLFLTSILAFFPTSWQSPTGMVAVIIYTWVILLRKPYYRKGDDRLHLCAQVEIFLILLAGHIFYNIGIPDKLSDVSMSVFLIGVFIGFIILFILQSANIVKKLIKLRKQQRKADFEKKQFEDEKDWMREQQEMAALNMYAISGNIMVEAEQRYQERAEELYDSTMQKPSDRRGRKIQSVAGVMPANQQNGGDQEDGAPIPEDEQKDGIVLDANADALAARIAGST